MLTPVHNILPIYNRHKNIQYEKLALISKQSSLSFQLLYTAQCAAAWLGLAICLRTNLRSARITQHVKTVTVRGTAQKPHYYRVNISLNALTSDIRVYVCFAVIQPTRALFLSTWCDSKVMRLVPKKSFILFIHQLQCCHI